MRGRTGRSHGAALVASPPHHQGNLIDTQWRAFLPALPDLGGALAPAFCGEVCGSSRFPGGLQVLSERVGDLRV